jgi:hypothetical protein
MNPETSAQPGRRLGMHISTDGVLLRAAAVCKRSRDWKHLEYMLVQLRDNLDTLRKQPDLETLQEFFDLWT